MTVCCSTNWAIPAGIALLGDMNNECAEASPVSITNHLFKTIFWVTLLHQLYEISLSEDLNNMHSVTSTVSLTDGLFKTIFQVKLSVQRLCLQGDLNSKGTQQSLPQGSLINTIFQVNYPITSKSCSLGELNNKCAEQTLFWCCLQMAFSRPSFQQSYHINSSKLCLPGHLNNDCA